MRVMQIVEQSGLSWYAVNTAINCYRTAGTAALKPVARGKKAGGGRMLSEAQERTIQKMICDKRPEQLKEALIKLFIPVLSTKLSVE